MGVRGLALALAGGTSEKPVQPVHRFKETFSDPVSYVDHHFSCLFRLFYKIKLPGTGSDSGSSPVHRPSPSDAFNLIPSQNLPPLFRSFAFDPNPHFLRLIRSKRSELYPKKMPKKIWVDNQAVSKVGRRRKSNVAESEDEGDESKDKEDEKEADRGDENEDGSASEG